MKEQIGSVVPRRKFVACDSDEARKTATGHSCKPLGGSFKNNHMGFTYFLLILAAIFFILFIIGMIKKY